MKMNVKFVVLFLCLLFITTQAWGQSSSTNYNLVMGAPVGGGGVSSSTGHKAGGAISASPAGSSSSTNYIINGGSPYTIVTSVLGASYTGDPMEIISSSGHTVEVSYNSTEPDVVGIFHYRPGGATAFIDADMTDAGGNILEYNIPTNLLNARGLEYYFTIDNGATALTLGASVDPYIFRIEIASNAQGLCPVALKNALYEIISIPIFPTSANNTSVFDDDFGPEDPKQWRLGRYYASSDSISVYPNAGLVMPGRGYWAIARGGKRFGTPGLSVLPTVDVSGFAYYELPLDSGWNQMGNPFAFDVEWDNVIFDDNGIIVPHANSAIQDAAYSYTGTQYALVEIIDGWRGVFVHANKHGVVALIPYNEFTGKKAHETAPFDGWQVKLRIETPSGFVDDDNFAGAHLNASNQSDRFDFHEPPPAPGGPRLAFVSENNELKRVDIRRDFSDGMTWNISLQNCVAGSRLTLDGADEIPAGMQVWLRRGNDLMHLTGSESIIINDSDREMELIIGTEAYLAGEVPNTLPLAFSLDQNYPNPFNPSTRIDFSIPKAGQTTLEIFNILGQKVVTLADDYLPAGRYSLDWQSVDDNGTEVGSGIYFYKLTYENMIEQKKMLLVK